MLLAPGSLIHASNDIRLPKSPFLPKRTVQIDPVVLPSPEISEVDCKFLLVGPGSGTRHRIECPHFFGGFDDTKVIDASGLLRFCPSLGETGESKHGQQANNADHDHDLD